MSNLTDRAAYLRGLADGMGLTKDTNEHKLLLEMLELMTEMAEKINELDEDVGEMEAYLEDVDEDLADIEETLFGDEDDDDCCCDDDDCDCDDEDEEYEELEELAFDCPYCGKAVMLKAADIAYDESPVCEHCGKPFFTDIEEEEDEEE